MTATATDSATETFAISLPNATATLRVRRPQPGQNHIVGIEWTGRPTAATLPLYLAWMKDVHLTLAAKWRISIAYIPLTSPRTAEVWVFEPDQPARLVETIRT